MTLDAKHAALQTRVSRLILCSTVLALAACQTAPVSAPAPPPGDVIEAPPLPPPPPVAAPAPPPIPVPRLPRIGLALGGGAARGFAHVGVIEVLEEAGIRPDLVAGTSAGSLIAALYADGKTGHEMALLAQNMDEGGITDWAFPSRGLIRGEALARWVRAQTTVRNIEQTRMPLGIVATDLDSGEGVLFRRGDIATAVRASSAVPAVFQPVRVGTREYVDGGLVAPVPVHFAREMGAELVVAVDISTPPLGNPTGDVMQMLLQTFAIMGQTIDAFELRGADVVLRPVLAGISSADFGARSKAIQAGRDAATKMLPTLKARIAAMTR